MKDIKTDALKEIASDGVNDSLAMANLSNAKRVPTQYALQQKKERERMDKYKKFEKINVKSKMLRSELPGQDGYKLAFFQG